MYYVIVILHPTIVNENWMIYLVRVSTAVGSAFLRKEGPTTVAQDVLC